MAKDRLADLFKERNGETQQVQLDIPEAEPLTGRTRLKDTFERAEILRQWIVSIEENLTAVKHYLNKLDDIKVNQKDLNDKIEALFQNNTSISQQIQSKLKEFEVDLRDVEVSSAEGRIKNIQYNTLKTQYQKIFKQNTSELENFRNVKKSQLKAQLRAKGVEVTDEQFVHLLEKGEDIQLFTENILAETAEAKRVLQDIEERHQQLLKIERMLEEVHDLFLQMAILIDNQQELIDRVEYQAEMAQNFVERGREDLKKGEQSKRKNLKWKIILIIVCVVLVALVLILILK